MHTPAWGAQIGTLLLARGQAMDPDGDNMTIDIRLGSGPWTRANLTGSYWPWWDATLSTRGLPPGLTTFRARATDEFGAQGFWNFSVYIVPLPDLAISTIEVGKGKVGGIEAELAPRVVRAIVTNVGVGASQGTNASAEVHARMASVATREPLGALTLPALAPGENVVLEWTWKTSGNVGDHEIVIVVDPAALVDELREDNNAGRTDTSVLVSGQGGIAVLAGDGSLASIALETAATQSYAIACGSGSPIYYNSIQCRQLTGRPGQQGAFDICAPRAPQNNLLASVLWTAWNAPNPTLASIVPGEPIVRHLQRGTCPHAFDIGNETVGVLDAAFLAMP